MHGIVLAGGLGTRLSPLTLAFSKQLLPVYNKPMIFYPIATLMAAGIRDISIVSTPNDVNLFKKLLGTGDNLGVSFSYETQSEPKGIAQCFLICEEAIKDRSCALVLGDNIFHGSGLGRDLTKYIDLKGASIFAYQVANPRDYGVVEIDNRNLVVSIEEKPMVPRSDYAIPGLYFFDKSVTERAKRIKPSGRGELEITDILKSYMNEGELKVSILPRGTAWLDTGTFDNLLDAANFVRVIESRQGIQIANLDEIAWRQGWITDAELVENLKFLNNDQGKYLFHLIEQNRKEI